MLSLPNRTRRPPRGFGKAQPLWGKAKRPGAAPGRVREERSEAESSEGGSDTAFFPIFGGGVSSVELFAIPCYIFFSVANAWNGWEGKGRGGLVTGSV